MSEAVAVVGAAFIGGLAGAILQPLVEHGLERVRAKELRRKAIESRLRRMISSWLQYANQAAIVGTEILARQDLNLSPLNAAEIIERVKLNDHTFLPWEAERIQDPQMRTLADELYATTLGVAVQLMTNATALPATISSIGNLRQEWSYEWTISTGQRSRTRI